MCVRCGIHEGTTAVNRQQVYVKTQRNVIKAHRGDSNHKHKYACVCGAHDDPCVRSNRARCVYRYTN